MNTNNVLTLQNLSVKYGGIKALTGLNLAVGSGEIVALIGANGAGKTTCLKAISGLLRPDTGDIFFEGHSIAGKQPPVLVKRGLVQVPEGRMVFSQQSVEDNLLLGAWTRRDKTGIAASLEEMYTWFPVLKVRRKQSAGTLSGGEQQMLALARAMMACPKLLLLDEPSLGLAPLMVKEIFKVIVRLNQRGTAILLVEQNARMALGVAHRGYVLESGCLTLSGPALDLLQNPQLQRAYLGDGAAKG